MATDHRVACAFFDIGGTLGDVSADLVLHVYDDTIPLLNCFAGALGLRLGVISNVPPTWDIPRVVALLKQAGIAHYFESAGLVTNASAKVSKPSPEIFRFAAQQMGVAPEECVYVGEDSSEVGGAVQAGMTGILRA